MFCVKEDQKCCECGDRIECRLCGHIVDNLEGAKVISCNSIEVHKRQKVRLMQLRLFEKGGDVALNIRKV